MALADFRTLVDDLVRDKDQVVSSTQRDAAITQAANRYSLDRARTIVVDAEVIAGPALALPAGWQPEFSSLVSIEYPIGERPPVLLSGEQVRLYQSPLGLQVQLPDGIAPGDSVRVGYTQAHVVDATTDTVPAHHRMPVACWAASILCGQIAAHYASEAEPTIAADAVDHGGKAERWRTRERDLRARYLSELGTSERRATPAGTQVNWQANDSRGGDRLFHQRRYR